jgi:hypothetical protein
MQDAEGKWDPSGPISIIEYAHIREWCAHLGCTEVELAEAIALVGNHPDQVRDFLAKGPQTCGKPPSG